MIKILRNIYQQIKKRSFKGTKNYWESRYASGGNSGAGSYEDKARFKADVLNKFVEEKSIDSVIELGCGDGNQLTLAKYPQYTGVDISETAIKICQDKFKGDNSKHFYVDGHTKPVRAQLSLSLDVIYHLIEDGLYNKYMEDLFNATTRYVIIYAWDYNGEQKLHVRHRKFTQWVTKMRPDFTLVQTIKGLIPGAADFYIFEKKTNA